ncbi:MAG: hypothetical protein GVY29_06295 [Spirochaetes bacterium]|nr:hypothetical protein [Spirochaetota bacterium]
MDRRIVALVVLDVLDVLCHPRRVFGANPLALRGDRFPRPFGFDGRVILSLHRVAARGDDHKRESE